MGESNSIAKNSFFLYLRMLITIGISFYTSRAILQLLGVEDYGIYNLVAGVIASFSFISNTIISANARFLSFSIGLNDYEKTNKTFSLCLASSLIIGIVLVLLCETFGLWWFNNKLVIPADKINDALTIFHISIINLFFSILFTPFNALVIAYEKMGVYAMVSVVNSILNLLLVLALFLGPFPVSNLVLYTFLTLLVNFSIGVFYIYYAKSRFQVVSFKPRFGSELRSLFAYSSWDVYGNMAVTARTSGVAILQNMFFGVVVNAAIGIATQVQNIVNQFSSNILFASKPQVVKHYAAGNIPDMMNIIHKTTKYTTLLLAFVIVPLLVEIDFVLKFWLGILPDHASSFVQWFLLFVLGANVSQCLIMGIHATGKVKNSSLINGTLYFLVLPISYYAYKQQASAEFPYILNVIFVLTGGFLNAIYLKMEIKSFQILRFYQKAVFPVLLLSIMTYVLLLFVKGKFANEYLSFFITCILSSLLMGLFSWYFILDAGIKAKCINYVGKLWR
ncbi:lipopolysaccharide biosynthesis protein [Sphingobacterium humi]|nr:MATE family efflux transporter [Sphingobacterium humi]